MPQSTKMLIIARRRATERAQRRLALLFAFIAGVVTYMGLFVVPHSAPATVTMQALPDPSPAQASEGNVVIHVGGPGQLWLDGAPIRPARLQTVSLREGQHVIMLQRGTRLLSRRVQVPAGEQVRVDFP